jgi:hypothetical protein
MKRGGEVKNKGNASLEDPLLLNLLTRSPINIGHQLAGPRLRSLTTTLFMLKLLAERKKTKGVKEKRKKDEGAAAGFKRRV